MANEADSASAKELCLNIDLAVQRSKIEQLLDETREAVALLEGRSGLSASGLTDLREILNRLAIAAALSGQELRAVRTTLVIARQLRTGLSLLPPESFPRLVAYLSALPAVEKLIQEIDLAIDDGGNVKDEASTMLRSLRREVQRIDASIKETLNKIIHSSAQSKALTEPLYTQRGGRYVLPVNASMRSAVNGIVHDSSASGLTVYIEPMAVLELSNKLRIKETEIEREVSRILEQLSRQAAEQCEPIERSYTTVVQLDAVMARGRLSLKYQGHRPDLSTDTSFAFIQARHPLLVLQDSTKSVVPNDINLGGRDGNTLIITGPNTGGKTVLLKTVGIFALMIRAGLLLPVSVGSTATIFTNVCADIGDEQSLEQSLSTFSSHMTNIVEIVGQCADGWLILLDEVGAGTDPREGAALARAVLEYLNESGAVTISTTHYGELKTLAYTEQGFVNGSLDFDEQTLSPTYRLRLGVPGSSKATTIAKRLGLNLSVIERAVQLVEMQDIDLQKTIDQLEVKLRQAMVREEEADIAKQEALKLRQEASEQVHHLETEARKLRDHHTSELESDYRLGRDYIKHLIADLQKQPSINKAQKTQQDLERVRDELGWPAKEAGGAPALQLEQEKARSTITLGQTVRVLSLNQRGIVSDIPTEFLRNPAAPVTVRCGSVNVKVQVSDLEIIPYEKRKTDKQLNIQPQAPKQRRSGRNTASSGAQVFVRTLSNTLDLRGQRVDAALAHLERFLDESVVNGVSPLMVIHGHGTGAVKSAVRQFLNDSSYADSYRSGEIYEGGDGVTMVTL